MNFSYGSHFGRVSGQPCAGIAQDEAPTFAMLDDFRFVFFGCRFSWPSFSKILWFNLFSADILPEQLAPLLQTLQK